MTSDHSHEVHPAMTFYYESIGPLFLMMVFFALFLLAAAAGNPILAAAMLHATWIPSLLAVCAFLPAYCIDPLERRPWPNPLDVARYLFLLASWATFLIAFFTAMDLFIDTWVDAWAARSAANGAAHIP